MTDKNHHETHRKIFCCGCDKKINARLTNGVEIYPHRKDLRDVPFWKCDSCKNYVGCHYKTKNRTNPLGCIPTDELRNARKHIHLNLDPIWKSGKLYRHKLYKRISDELGYQFHTAKIKTIEDARKIYLIVKKIREDL